MRLLAIALVGAALVVLPFGALVSLVPSNAGPNLEFVPLVAVAPDDAAPTAGTPACVTPAPVISYAFYHCYTPGAMAAAYGVDALHAAGITGRGETIVIVDSYGSPTALRDLQFFSATFGLPAPDLTIIHPTGTPAFNNAMGGSPAGWAFETSLDLQWAHAMAPDAKLVLISANPAETEGVQGFPSIFLGERYAVEHYPGSVISQSFAVTEQSFRSAASVQVARFDQVYREAAANHVTVVAAAGDSGSANVDKQGRLYPFPTAQWPASDPLVVGAGGTWLQYGWRWDPTSSADEFYGCLRTQPFGTCAASYLNSDPAPGSTTEAVWKEDWIQAATGGGLSVLFPTPSFQAGIPEDVLQGRRGVPDLSWNAAVDGAALVYTSFPGARVGWHIVGGTSASTPQIAAVIALANQLAHGLGKESAGWVNPVLYTLPFTDFSDIVPRTFGTGSGVVTLDSNAEYGTSIPGMKTTPGYDLTTGLGTPRAWEFVHDLAAALP